MAQMFKDEEAFADNATRQNFVFMGYPFTPPLAKEDYATVVKELQKELPLRFWYFLDEVTTNELMRKVWRAILRADLCVFDTSGGNPNVAFELGLAVAKDKRCITMLKTGEPNPLGSADMSYSERMEYDSIATLREQLRTFVWAKSTALRLLDELSYKVAEKDDSVSRDAVRDRLLAVVTHVFNKKSITKTGARGLMKTEPLTTAALAELRSADVFKLEGIRGGAKYVFTDGWAYHDHEVTGDY